MIIQQNMCHYNSTSCVPDYTRWRSEGARGEPPRAAGRRGDKNGGDNGKNVGDRGAPGISWLLGRQNCSPPRAPITHVTPLTIQCEVRGSNPTVNGWVLIAKATVIMSLGMSWLRAVSRWTYPFIVGGTLCGVNLHDKSRDVAKTVADWPASSYPKRRIESKQRCVTTAAV